jgi:flagellar motor protein MotB
MYSQSAAFGIVLAVFSLSAPAQSPPEQRAAQPLYQVTIVSRTTRAINYGYLSAPTRIGFRGTPVAPSAKGTATIEPGRGATQVNMRVDELPPPGRFGPQYLTYVVWAISPDGRAQNLGELILDGSDEGKLTTSTAMQTFALIVTAEPYYSVSQPSEVVVLENIVTSDTIGKVQEVNATYELLPRKPYKFDTAAAQTRPSGQPVSQEQYESITALYQALNAIQIAQSQNADRYAPEQMSRARQIYNKARSFPVHLSKEIVSMAREATQIAEDSRAIAVKRAAAEAAADAARAVTEPANQEKVQAPAPESRNVAPPPQPARVPADRTPEQSRARTAVEPASQPQPPVTVDGRQFLRDDPGAQDNRRQLLAALPRYFEVLDSSRGVVITIPGDALDSDLTRAYFTAIAAAVKPYKGLHLNVEAHDGRPGAARESERDGRTVRDGLIRAGVSPDIVVVESHGNSRPRASTASPGGRAQNRRVEIVIAGDPIGSLATWDRSYTLRPR